MNDLSVCLFVCGICTAINIQALIVGSREYHRVGDVHIAIFIIQRSRGGQNLTPKSFVTLSLSLGHFV